ncbi:DUF3043 domain-containing protein [Aeromicrobium sp. CTD01-1L150]|uniref:DUF3043 domain-containing protein n=1 Tax=Aeromicrobium sp. CTD01-1L150 TaxID=3341830 RepID=UPI0035BFEAA8
MSEESSSRKGRPTPSRKEAEAARKKAMKKPLTRREQALRQREARAKARRQQQEALRSGDDAHLPPRDRGPVRALVRDVVDRRVNVSEYLLPILLVVVLVNLLNASVFQQPQLDAFVLLIWLALIILTIFDELRMIRLVKRTVVERFGPEKRRGNTGYAVLRSTQLRRFRLPKPQIARGAPLRDRY